MAVLQQEMAGRVIAVRPAGYGRTPAGNGRPGYSGPVRPGLAVLQQETAAHLQLSAGDISERQRPGLAVPDVGIRAQELSRHQRPELAAIEHPYKQ
jgi:hypothetical protein